MVRLASEEKCTGCMACYNICPQSAILIQKDEQGFACPAIDTSLCVCCNLCTSVCSPVQNYSNRVKPNKVYAGWKYSDKERLLSNSGGVASALAEMAIEKGFYVAGACIAEDLTVKHIIASSIEEVERFRMSKYVQSDIADIYKRIKNLIASGNSVLFFGTPCQADAVKRIVGSKNADSLVTVDLICHGVPSPEYLKQHLVSFDNLDNIKFYSFRDNNTYKFSVKLRDETVLLSNYPRDTYLYAYFKNVLDRESCHNCQYSSVYRPSDITLGDFWGIKSMNSPGVMCENQKGISAVLVNTDKGRRLLEECKNCLFLEERDLDEIVAYNPFLREIVSTNKDRFAFRNKFLELGFEAACLWLVRKNKVKDNLGHIIMRAKYALKRIRF